MSAPNDGGPAFPDSDGQVNYTGGMTLRDYFAGQALAGWGEVHHAVARTVSKDKIYPEAMAQVVYEIADAMLAAREKGGAA